MKCSMNYRMKALLMGTIAVMGATLMGMDKQVEAKNNGFYPKSLADFSATGKPYGAGVMPYYEDEKGGKHVLFGREINSFNKREWAFFSGGSEVSTTEKQMMEHPLDCATREFYEEAIIGKTLGWSESELKEYIKKNTTEVIAEYSRFIDESRPLIMYVVKFKQKEIETIIKAFKSIFNEKDLDEKYKEKDALALVEYQNLIDVIKENKPWIPLEKNVPYWFNKDKEDKALLFYMPFRLLRARHVTEQLFNIDNKPYHYVKDEQEKFNDVYQFFALERVQDIPSKL